MDNLIQVTELFTEDQNVLEEDELSTIQDTLLGKRKKRDSALENPEQIDNDEGPANFTVKPVCDEKVSDELRERLNGMCHVVWYQLETWKDAKSMDTLNEKITVLEFVRRIQKEYEWLIEAKAEQISILLQDKIIPIGEYVSEDLYRSSMNHPISVCWPKAMKYYRREDFMAEIYPQVSRLKKMGTVTHSHMFKRALERQGKVEIMNTRLDILQYLRIQKIEAKEMWRQDQRMQEFCRILLKNALDKKVDPRYEQFQLFDAFRVTFMKFRREFKLAAFDTMTNTHGILVVTHKKMVKEAVYQAMEDLRFLCRARNIDYMYALASNLHEFQFVYYDRQRELTSHGADFKDFFQLSPIYKLYIREKNYTYADNDLKMIISLIREISLRCFELAKRYKAKQIVESSCIDNTDELF
ncbi:hypothetical protein FGO68_gene5846 [Halteria grandinella]|uniref:Uncharacterized protein n=1 Tax=Halteria grandinella TaxID=5974 RepID=A0A8J8NMH5_HALGN|nr:hypothetical protein FGO68_gene5846 [Halteria grandinella]